jgi:predicted acyltransferase
MFRSLDGIWGTKLTGVIEGQLHHVKWEGFQFEDLIFPLFLFIIGVVLPYSISRRLERGDSRARVFAHIVVRSAMLIFLGILYNGLLDLNFEKMRWVGVLQRMGLCYFFAAVIVMCTRWRAQAIICGGILVLYWAAMMFVPVPGHGAGVLTPEGCLSSYIDQIILPGGLCYGYGDNEGVISTFPAVCTALLGVLAGHWLRSNASGYKKTAGLAIAGVICLAVGYAWSRQFYSVENATENAMWLRRYLWGLHFPIIKNVWTSTFVLVAGGWSLLLLALFYLVIDVWGWKKWAFFFIVIGMNPITIYFGQRVIPFGEISGFFVNGLASASGVYRVLIITAAVVAVKWLFLLFLYRRKIFLKV